MTLISPPIGCEIPCFSWFFIILLSIVMHTLPRMPACSTCTNIYRRMAIACLLILTEYFSWALNGIHRHEQCPTLYDFLTLLHYTIAVPFLDHCGRSIDVTAAEPHGSIVLTHPMSKIHDCKLYIKTTETNRNIDLRFIVCIINAGWIQFPSRACDDACNCRGYFSQVALMDSWPSLITPMILWWSIRSSPPTLTSVALPFGCKMAVRWSSGMKLT